MDWDNTSLCLFLPVFHQQDAHHLSGASRAAVNNWVARGYLQPVNHPKTQALGGRLFSFWDILKLKVMVQLTGMKVQAQFASRVGDLVVAEVERLKEDKEVARNPLEILLVMKEGSLSFCYRFPAQKYFDLSDIHAVVPCHRLFYRTFHAVYDETKAGNLKSDFRVMQSAYTLQEKEEIFLTVHEDIWRARSDLLDGISMQQIQEHLNGKSE
jgi:hypothetical protein